MYIAAWSDYGRLAMFIRCRARVVASLTVVAAVVGGVGSVSAGAPPGAAGSAIPATCAADAQAELTTVIHRIYNQALHGREEASAVKRITRSTTLARAVASGRPSAVRAALIPLIKNQITRINVSSSNGTTIRIGSVPSYAPAGGPITLHGRVVGSYVLSVGNDAAFVSLVHSVTTGTVRFVVGGAPTVGSFPVATFPSGHAIVEIVLRDPPPWVCGATTADTQFRTTAFVARNVMNGESHSHQVTLTLRYAAQNTAFREAIAAGNPAAVRAAIIGFFRNSHFHIVRVRTWKGGRLINDVGGPYVLSPASSPIRSPAGKVIGRFMLAVQDDTGYIKLVHLFTGADVVLQTIAGTVPGSNLTPGPRFAAGPSTTTYNGRTYRDFGLAGIAFPSGTLKVSLLEPR